MVYPFFPPFVLLSLNSFSISYCKCCLRVDTILLIIRYNWKQWVLKHSLPDKEHPTNEFGVEVSVNKAKVLDLTWVDTCSAVWKVTWRPGSMKLLTVQVVRQHIPGVVGACSGVIIRHNQDWEGLRHKFGLSLCPLTVSIPQSGFSS